MKRSDASMFCCPKCRGGLTLIEQAPALEEVWEGSLRCERCRYDYPIIRSIPRFVADAGYAASFGYQWKAFAKTQVGGAQTSISEARFYATTGWPRDLTGQVILEAGCGAGRFSGIALATGAEVYSFDLSQAVEASLDNIQSAADRRRHHLFQASIYAVPLPHQMFDKIFCFGVLQHCPDVEGAYRSLVPFLKPGGEIVVDCYLSQPLKHAFNLKYWLRPFFRWWKPSWLFAFWSVMISLAYDLKAFLSRLPVAGDALASLIPIGRLNYEPEHHFTVAELKEIKTLSAFDMLSPRYDKCQTLDDVRRWMESELLEVVSLGLGYNGINAKARKLVGPAADAHRSLA